MKANNALNEKKWPELNLNANLAGCHLYQAWLGAKIGLRLKIKFNVQTTERLYMHLTISNIVFITIITLKYSDEYIDLQSYVKVLYF